MSGWFLRLTIPLNWCLTFPPFCGFNVKVRLQRVAIYNKAKEHATELTVNVYMYSVRAERVASFTHIDAVVVCLHVDDRHLEPDFHHRQHLSVTQQLMDVVFVVINDLFLGSLTLNDVVPPQLRSRVTWYVTRTCTVWSVCISLSSHSAPRPAANVRPKPGCEGWTGPVESGTKP